MNDVTIKKAKSGWLVYQGHPHSQNSGAGYNTWAFSTFEEVIEFLRANEISKADDAKES